MGWAVLLGVAIAAAVLLWLLRLPRVLWSFTAAAMMLGAAGYALQGTPDRPGRPAQPADRAIAIDPGIIELRGAMTSKISIENAYLIAAEAMLRSGESGTAVAVMQGAVRKYPRDFELWTGLGTMLSLHNGGLVSPAAKLAFDQGMKLAPRHPSPPFFAGLAYANAGQFMEARPLWARALALTPPKASYRPEIAGRLAALDQAIAVNR
jgi:cytochrome c-type biogenesis protein CcmH